MLSLLGSCWRASFSKRSENPTEEDIMGIRKGMLRSSGVRDHQGKSQDHIYTDWSCWADSCGREMSWWGAGGEWNGKYHLIYPEHIEKVLSLIHLLEHLGKNSKISIKILANFKNNKLQKIIKKRKLIIGLVLWKCFHYELEITIEEQFDISSVFGE